MALNAAALNQACDAVTVETIKLHSGAPGAAGTSNLVAGTETAIVLGASAGGVRSMAQALEIAVPAGTISHYSLWFGTELKATDAFSPAETYASPGTAKINSATLTVANVV
jgi:hypothetical protein